MKLPTNVFASTLSAAALLIGSTVIANAAAEKYTLDASHSQIVFSYNHLGFSTTYGMFSGFEGEIMFDQDAPEKSTVRVSMPTKSMFTGWEARDGHFMSADFFDFPSSTFSVGLSFFFFLTFLTFFFLGPAVEAPSSILARASSTYC